MKLGFIKGKNPNPSNGQKIFPPKDMTRAQLLGRTELPTLAAGKEETTTTGRKNFIIFTPSNPAKTLKRRA